MYLSLYLCGSIFLAYCFNLMNNRRQELSLEMKLKNMLVLMTAAEMGTFVKPLFCATDDIYSIKEK